MHTRECTHARAHACKHGCMHTHMYARTCACTHASSAGHGSVGDTTAGTTRFCLDRAVRGAHECAGHTDTIAYPCHACLHSNACSVVRTHVWTSVHACARAHTRIRTHARTHARTHTRMHTHEYACMHARTHVYSLGCFLCAHVTKTGGIHCRIGCELQEDGARTQLCHTTANPCPPAYMHTGTPTHPYARTHARTRTMHTCTPTYHTHVHVCTYTDRCHSTPLGYGPSH